MDNLFLLNGIEYTGSSQLVDHAGRRRAGSCWESMRFANSTF